MFFLIFMTLVLFQDCSYTYRLKNGRWIIIEEVSESHTANCDCSGQEENHQWYCVTSSNSLELRNLSTSWPLSLTLCHKVFIPLGVFLGLCSPGNVSSLAIFHVHNYWLSQWLHCVTLITVGGLLRSNLMLFTCPAATVLVSSPLTSSAVPPSASSRKETGMR